MNYTKLQFAQSKIKNEVNTRLPIPLYKIPKTSLQLVHYEEKENDGDK
jgi:hypothetical protein